MNDEGLADAAAANPFRLPRLHPRNRSKGRLWSLTIYDNRTRSMSDTDQHLAGLSSYSDLKQNADGSIDLYFGPGAPKGFDRTGSR
jgi:hypothetical protein